MELSVSSDVLAQFGLEGVLTGSFTKVNDFTTNTRFTQYEEGFIGSDFDDLDQQIHGYDFSFTTDEFDAQAVDLHRLIAFLERNKLPPPVITARFSYIYRIPNVLPRTEVYSECILMRSERGAGGRKEYIKNSFEGKARDVDVIVG